MECNSVLCEPIKQEVCYWCENYRHSGCQGVDEFAFCSCKCPFNENLETKKCLRCNEDFKVECEHEELCLICSISMMPTPENIMYCNKCDESGNLDKMLEHANNTKHSLTNDRPITKEIKSCGELE